MPLDQNNLDQSSFDQSKLDDFLGKAVGDLSAGYGGVMVSLGNKLGLYKAMAGAGPLTVVEVAGRSGCAARYVEEWLNAQVAGDYLDYHPESGCYELPPEKAYVLADDQSPVFIPAAWNVPASMWFDEEQAVAAFRSGEGVPWGSHHERLYCGVASFYRNAYKGSLVQEWLPSIEGALEKLTRGARVADIGCGHGHATVLMAEAFPESRFWGYDSHGGSIAEARRVAAETGVTKRVHFGKSDATGYAEGGFDLICFFDCLHDMGHPVAAARHARESLAPGGRVMLVEPFAEDRVEDNATAVGRLYYAASTTLCCAHAIAEDGSHVLGAQAGEARLAQVFRAAGFNHFRRAFQTPFNLVLEARV